LNPERWARIEELFHRAAECEPKHRPGLLDEACSDDPELRREVEALLSCQESAGKQLIVSILDPATGRGPEIFRFALVVNDGTWFLELSPDGTRVAATRTLKGPIYILSFAGEELQQVCVKGWSNLLSFFWAADEKGLTTSSSLPRHPKMISKDSELEFSRVL
jgi:hypothetical protein